MPLPTTLESAGGASKSGSILDIVKSGQGILDIFKGKTVNTEGAQTTQTALSPEAVNALLNQILGGTQGLATVASGQKVAGLYNSSVGTLLTNDLLSRAAGEVAVKSAPTTTTSRNTQVQAPQLNLGNSLLGIGASVLGKKAFSATGADKKVDDFIASIFGKNKGKIDSLDLEDANLGTASTNLAGSGSTDIASEAISSGVSGGFSGGSDALTSAINSGAVFGGLADTGFSLSADTMDSAGLFGSIGADTASSFAGEGADIAGVAGDLTGGVPVAGPLIKLLSGDAEGAAGSAVGGAIGSAFGPVGTIVGSTIGGSLGNSVVCTECYLRGDMSVTRYIASSIYGIYNDTARAGYHIWGVPLVRLMKKSKLVYHICSYIANSYAAYIADENNKLGFVFVCIGYPICWTLGVVKLWLKRKLILAS